MGVVAVILLAWGVMEKPCTSVVVHDQDIDFAPVASDICGAYRQRGSMNMSRQSLDMASLQGMCGFPWNILGGIFGGGQHTDTAKEKEDKEKALVDIDTQAGKMKAIKESVEKCCKEYPDGHPQDLRCTAELGDMSLYAEEFKNAMERYYKFFAATEALPVKAAACKIFSFEAATAPAREIATGVVMMNNELKETCIHIPDHALKAVNDVAVTVTKGFQQVPKIVADLSVWVKDNLLSKICKKG